MEKPPCSVGRGDAASLSGGEPPVSLASASIVTEFPLITVAVSSKATNGCRAVTVTVTVPTALCPSLSTAVYVKVACTSIQEQHLVTVRSMW